MKSSNIGGQAVLEGIMMKNKESYAVAVRKPDGEIEVEKGTYEGIAKGNKIAKLPFIRGVFGFLDSLILGMKTLTYSASFYEEEEESQKPQTEEERVKAKKKEDQIMNITVAFACVFAVVIFMAIPYGIMELLGRWVTSHLLQSVIEGLVRIGLFIGYIVLISKMDDINRTFMYHGAEHKCINCIEHGMELNVENVRKSSKEHKRCGTSFIFFVLLISIVLLFFIQTDSRILRIVIRIALVPVIAGIAYELIKWAGNSDHPVICMISKPGLWMQGLTTKEPDDSMIEVAIEAVDAVFDWKTYLKEQTGEQE